MTDDLLAGIEQEVESNAPTPPSEAAQEKPNNFSDLPRKPEEASFDETGVGFVRIKVTYKGKKGFDRCQVFNTMEAVEQYLRGEENLTREQVQEKLLFIVNRGLMREAQAELRKSLTPAGLLSDLRKELNSESKRSRVLEAKLAQVLQELEDLDDDDFEDDED